MDAGLKRQLRQSILRPTLRFWVAHPRAVSSKTGVPLYDHTPGASSRAFLTATATSERVKGLYRIVARSRSESSARYLGPVVLVVARGEFAKVLPGVGLEIAHLGDGVTRGYLGDQRS